MAVTSKRISPDAKPKVTRAKKVVAPPPEVVYVSAFAVGNRVTHGAFGDGEIAQIDRDQLSIKFDDNTTKVILDGFVKRQKS